MITLRKGDGFGDTTPRLRPDVQRLQRALIKAGHEVDEDGLFGEKTRRAVERFQREHGLEPDGVVGPATWDALQPRLAARERRPSFPDVPGFDGFHGDLEWIHAQEGHAGKPYWPGGQSGVTLDPGFDLGFEPIATTRELYGSFLSAVQLTAVGKVSGIHGEEARRALQETPNLDTIRVSEARASRIMPHVAVSYWKDVARRFPRLLDDATPGSVQTALLSLAYNRGARNRGLSVLGDPIAGGRWLEVAAAIGAMQQDHPLQGIRIRRRHEADLIRREMEFA